MQKTKALIISVLISGSFLIISGLLLTQMYELNYFGAIQNKLKQKQVELTLNAESQLLKIHSTINLLSKKEIRTKSASLFDNTLAGGINQFVVLHNGTLLAHSDNTEYARLNGNIAADEFNYNLDLILRPLKNKTSAIFISDYHILEYKFPFQKGDIKRLKQITNNLDKNGILLTKMITIQDGELGVVAMIINKAPLYSIITSELDHLTTVKITIIGIDLLITIVIGVGLFFLFQTPTTFQKELIPEAALHPILTPSTSNIYEENIYAVNPSVTPSKVDAIIQDAIPIKKRGNYSDPGK